MSGEYNDSMINELTTFFIGRNETRMALIAPPVTLSGSVASVTFSSIPQTFRHLVVIAHIRTDRSAEVDQLLLRFNADTGNNYNWQRHDLSGVATAGAVTRGTSSIQIANCEAANSTASCFSPLLAYIYFYTNTSHYKYTSADSSTAGNISADADLTQRHNTGRWENANAITSITLLPNTGPNFVSGCIFQLYGIR